MIFTIVKDMKYSHLSHIECHNSQGHCGTIEMHMAEWVYSPQQHHQGRWLSIFDIQDLANKLKELNSTGEENDNSLASLFAIRTKAREILNKAKLMDEEYYEREENEYN